MDQKQLEPAGINSLHLSERRSQHMKQRLDQARERLAHSQIPRRPIDLKLLPLSFAQQRLWFLDQLYPHNPFYNICVSVSLEGQLNVAVLEKSINAIIQRHEILRTTFQSGEDQPYQHILPEIHLLVAVVDLQDRTLQMRDPSVDQLVREEFRTPFDLATGPLLRLHLLRLAADHHLLLLTMHHIIADNWTTSVIIKELNSFYYAFTHGLHPDLATLSLQYADFAIWQQQQFQNGALERQKLYWTQKLAGASPILTLPTDHPRPPLQSFLGKTLFFNLSSSLTQALQDMSQQEGATLFMALLAAFALLLSRLSSQKDLLIGTPIANRTRNQLEDMIGFFSNTLALHINLAGAASFREVLARTREVSLEAYNYQDLPFEQLVHALRLKRDRSRNPLVQAVFSFQSVPTPVGNLLGLHGKEVVYDNGAAKFDLTLNMKKKGSQLAGKLNYNADLFNPTTCTRFLQEFQSILESVALNPEQPLT